MDGMVDKYGLDPFNPCIIVGCCCCCLFYPITLLSSGLASQTWPVLTGLATAFGLFGLLSLLGWFTEHQMIGPRFGFHDTGTWYLVILPKTHAYNLSHFCRNFGMSVTGLNPMFL
jgi:hypothetical protein